jgi:hypothetical protein
MSEVVLRRSAGRYVFGKLASRSMGLAAMLLISMGLCLGGCSHSEGRPLLTANQALGTCVGRGGVEGVYFWGPGGSYCNGTTDWGRFGAVEICPCSGKGGLSGVQLWGPKGAACGGFRADWGTYGGSASEAAACVRLSDVRLCSCEGNQHPIANQTFWGPEGRLCLGTGAGSPATYTNDCVSVPPNGG